jgi:hypothetical protein
VGSRKTFPLYKTSGLVNQLVVASWKHPGRSAPTEDICKPPIDSRESGVLVRQAQSSRASIHNLKSSALSMNMIT